MMIEVKNLSFSYGKRKQKVFNDFSLTLEIYFALFNDWVTPSARR